HDVLRNDVAHKRRAADSAARRGFRARIVDYVFEDGRAQGIGSQIAIRQGSAEIAGSICRRRHGAELTEGDGLVVELFQVEKEEGFASAVVNLGNVYRSAKRAARVGLAVAFTPVRLKDAVGVKHGLVGHVVVETAVGLVGSALGSEVEHCAQTAAVLGG